MAGRQKDPGGRNQAGEPMLYYVFFSSTAVSGFTGTATTAYSFVKVPASVAARLQEIDGEIRGIEMQLPHGRYDERPDLARRSESLVAEWNRLTHDSGYVQLRTQPLRGSPFTPGQVFAMEDIMRLAPGTHLTQVAGQRRETEEASGRARR